MIGLDGIALVNVVVNPSDAQLTRQKELQTRITHNDGGSWKALDPPSRDSLGQTYPCSQTVSVCEGLTHGNMLMTMRI